MSDSAEDKKKKKAEYDRLRYQRLRSTLLPKFRKRHAACRESDNEKSREYHRDNRDRLLAQKRQKWAERTPEQREARNARERARRALKKDPHNVEAAVAVMAPQMQECPRLRVRALHLPCGQRPECVGPPKCPRLEELCLK